MRTAAVNSGRLRGAALLLLALLPLQIGAAADAPAIVATDPGQLIDSVARAILTDIEAHRAEYRKDSVKLDKLVSSLLLPHFDTEYAARLVLATHWPAATAEQRERFRNGFYHSLLYNYGNELVDFDLSRLQVLPYKGDPQATVAVVRTFVRRSSGVQVAVNYTLRRTDEGWKAYDVIIEGISYVKSFRDDFGAEIDQKGLDEVISRLESQFGPTVSHAG
ncbi:MAG TPA: ABC transporter substrate-binding protein [Steroidobacteraceae bacterium]